jgi:hypothetical protein
VKYNGFIHVDKDGKYQMTWKTGNLTWIKVDGRQVLKVVFSKTDRFTDPPTGGEKNIYLKTGSHAVEVVTVFQTSGLLPEIVLHREGSSEEGKSLWSSFSF